MSTNIAITIPHTMPGEMLRYTIGFMEACRIVHNGGCFVQLKWYVDIKFRLVKCVFFSGRQFEFAVMGIITPITMQSP